jgi:hypothetical protein
MERRARAHLDRPARPLFLEVERGKASEAARAEEQMHGDDLEHAAEPEANEALCEADASKE